MELKPHFRVVRFTPTPEILEPVNVALLMVNEKARLITDADFPKLHCVAPRFNSSILRFLLDGIQDDLATMKPEDAYVFLASRTGQLQVGEPHAINCRVSADFESKLVDIYLKRQTRPHSQGETHFQYVDTLLDDALRNVRVDTSHLLKRASPKDFLSSRSLGLLEANSIKFSRVMNGTRRLVLMDGLNLAVTSKQVIQKRSQVIGFGFYTIGRVQDRLEQLEQRKVHRASFIFGRDVASDPELNYCVEQMNRDADLIVDPRAGINTEQLHDLLATASETKNP